ncbi:MAG TPA: hypothetical protein VFQ40_08765, partial [Actinomycetota bacterium]|nr:hypothetical protein [Actinomycetota bacterium]
MKTEERVKLENLYELAPIEEPSVRRGSFLYGGVALLGIWAGVVLTSLFAPDLVTGTTQDHFPLPFVVVLLAGLAGTRSIVRAFNHGMGGMARWGVYALTLLLIWAAVTLVSIYVPATITGTDPTQLPIAAIVAPIAGAILTGPSRSCSPGSGASRTPGARSPAAGGARG